MRVRFAPSPTGHLHVGSVRTALFNWLLARHEKGAFILRIEDTDKERSKREYLEAALRDLKWLGLDWDEGPYFQSERLSIYRERADNLLQGGKAYPCFCTPAELAEKRAEAQAQKKAPGYDGKCRNLSEAERRTLEGEGRKAVLRFKSPQSQSVTVKDAIRGNVDFSGELLEDFVIVKSDGFPIYNFACAVDDHLMGITHVLRGEEHLSNTPRQILIYRAFGWEPPVFGHLSIILDEQRKKLSKREGATYLSEFREAGFLPEALLNFLALLGWAPGGDLEILPMSELIQRFGFSGIGKSPAVFDFKKLEWMNGQYIKQSAAEDLALRVVPFLEERGFSAPADLRVNLARVFRERIKTLRQFAGDAAYFFTDDFEVDRESAAKLLTPEALAHVEKLIPSLEETPFTEETLESAIRQYAESQGLKAGEMIHPIRLLLTGKKVSPGIFEVMALLGKEKTLHRLKKGVRPFRNQASSPSSL